MSTVVVNRRNRRRNRQSDARRRGPELPPESHIMRARKGAAARLSRVGIVALALGVGTFALLTMEIRGRATAQLSKDPENRPSLIMTPDREFAASSYVHEQLRPSVPGDAHSDATQEFV
jgi:hypothetical protein